MKYPHLILLLGAILIGCSEEEASEEQVRNSVIESLITSNWNIDPSYSTAGNGISVNEINIDIKNDLTFDFSGGGLDTYLKGGVLMVDQQGHVFLDSLIDIENDSISFIHGEALYQNQLKEFKLNFSPVYDHADCNEGCVLGTGDFSLLFQAVQ